MIHKVLDGKSLRGVHRFASGLVLRETINDPSNRRIISGMVVHHVITGRRKISREPASMDFITPSGEGEKIDA